MSPSTNPDNGMMENQQAQDLGHPLDEGDTPQVEGAAIESAIPRLPEGVDADGFLASGAEAPNPDRETEAARRKAVAGSKAQPQRRG